MKRVIKKKLTTVLLIVVLCSSSLFTSVASAYCEHPAVYQLYEDTINLPGSHTVQRYVYVRPIGYIFDDVTCYKTDTYYIFQIRCSSCNTVINTITLFQYDSNHSLNHS